MEPPPCRLSGAFVVRLADEHELDQLRLPGALDDRLRRLLDRRDQGDALTDVERSEAEGLVDLAELLSLLRLRAQASPT